MADLVDPASLAVARLLLQAQQDVEAVARGNSMRGSIPSGATIRIRRVACEVLRVGDVVVTLSGGHLTNHRVVAARARRKRVVLVTRGDANIGCDPPLEGNDVLGQVVAWRDGGEWRDVGAAPRRPGWRGLATEASEQSMRLALALDERLASAVARGLQGLRRAWQAAGEGGP